MSNVNKPTIPAEVADAIEELRERADSESILYSVLNDPTAGLSVDALRTIPFDTLLAALVNGYEREMTVEERLAVAYRNISEEYSECMADGSSEEVCFANGMRYALDSLGVKIKGVNA